MKTVLIIAGSLIAVLIGTNILVGLLGLGVAALAVIGCAILTMTIFMYREMIITNALLVEQLLLLTEEEELECGGDCEQCICGKL